MDASYHVDDPTKDDLDEADERKHRRDFVGTPLEKTKKRSRSNQKKRKRSDSSETDPTTLADVAMVAEEASLSPPNKKKVGPLAAKGKSRAFDILADNSIAPDEVIAMINDSSKSNEELAEALASFMWEPKSKVLVKCLNVFSKEMICNWIRELIQIETSGGMKTGLGERRKSPGGVFFALIARDASQEDRAATISFPLSTTNQRQPVRKPKKINYVPIDDPTPAIKLNPGRKPNPFSVNFSKVKPSSSTLSHLAPEDLGEPV